MTSAATVAPAEIGRGQKLCAQADRLQRQGRKAEALKLYREVLTFLPQSTWAKKGIRECQANTGKPPGHAAVSGAEEAGLPLSGLQAGSPWPKFLCNARNNALGHYVGAQRAHLRWKFITGSRVQTSSAIGADGTIYVESYDPNKKEVKSFFDSGGKIPPIGHDQGDLYAINSDGSLKWKLDTGGGNSSPAIGADGTIYVGAEDGSLYAVSPRGKLKWKFPTGQRVWSSPAIGADGTIYLVSYDGSLCAIDPDGALRWRQLVRAVSNCSPVIGLDGTIYAVSYDEHGLGEIHAINPDGSLRWKSPLDGNDAPCSPAIGADGTLYVSTMDQHFHYSLYAINPDGSVKWKLPGAGGDNRCSPAIGADGTIYVSARDDSLCAVSPNGNLKWKLATGGGWPFWPAIGADGTVYIGGYNGVYAVR